MASGSSGAYQSRPTQGDVGNRIMVFTLPAPFSDLAYSNQSVVYTILFKAAAETLQTIAADPKHLGARIGLTLVLHTWGSAMAHHPHVHGIVPGGGLSIDGERWIHCRPGFFLPVRVLSRLFRRLFLDRLYHAYHVGDLKFFGEHRLLTDTKAFADWLKQLRKTEWVVYAKRPFAGPEAVLSYLSRYTHRVAISNSRLLAFDAATLSKCNRRDVFTVRYATLPRAVPIRRTATALLHFHHPWRSCRVRASREGTVRRIGTAFL